MTLPSPGGASGDAVTEIVSSGRIPVVTGFIACDASGMPVLLGRNGSDYSAAAVAS
ncbi:hypothetical protein [Thermogymnomonas acidicola]|uniref:amino acid kinase family protein n=1 Tax=Thermogymnomonas acidicola TaxID=399579 RepID=UPI000AB0177B|nr:hypothetical protein [Thermogymnomonas acidicola]